MTMRKTVEQALHRYAGGVRLAVAAGLTFALSGCLATTNSEGFGFFADRAAQPGMSGQQLRRQAPLTGQMETAELARGRVVVQVPRGYCIDRGSLRRGLTGGFALIAACNSLTGDVSGADVEPVVMTVQIQPGFVKRELPSADELADAMEPAKALRRINGDGLTLVQLDSGGDKGLPSGDPRHWRGALVINGYLVGLALYAPNGSAMAGDDGQTLIHSLAENLLKASPVRDYSPRAESGAAKKTE